MGLTGVVIGGVATRVWWNTVGTHFSENKVTEGPEKMEKQTTVPSVWKLPSFTMKGVSENFGLVHKIVVSI